MSTAQICELSSSSKTTFQECLIQLNPSELNIIIHKLKDFPQRKVRLSFENLLSCLSDKQIKSCTPELSLQQVIFTSLCIPHYKLPLFLKSLSAIQEESLLEEAETLASERSGLKGPNSLDGLSTAHIAVALEYESGGKSAENLITANVRFLSQNQLQAFLSQASKDQVLSALSVLKRDKFSFAIRYIKDEHLKEYVSTLSLQEIFRLLDLLEEKQYRAVFRDLDPSFLRELLPLLNSEYVCSAVRTLPAQKKEQLLSPHYSSINDHRHPTSNFSPYIFSLAAYSRNEALWSSLLARVPSMNFDQIMGIIPALNRAQVQAIIPLIQDLIQLEAFSKSINLWHIDVAIDTMSPTQKEMLTVKFSTSDDNLLLFLNEIPPLTVATGFLFEENKEKLLGLCSLMSSTQLHVMAKRMTAKEISETIISINDQSQIKSLINCLSESKVMEALEIFEFEHNDVKETLNDMERECLSLDIEINKSRKLLNEFSLLAKNERNHMQFLEIRDQAISSREHILHLRSVLRSWKDFLQVPLKLKTVLPDNHSLQADYANLRWHHRKLSNKLSEQTHKLDCGNGSGGILLELQMLKPESVRREDSEGCALRGLAMSGTNAWDNASVWELYENVRKALEEIGGTAGILQDWDYGYEDVMEVGLTSLQDFENKEIDSLGKLKEYIKQHLNS